ncbi:WD40 repeat-like protein [Meredithblackwellia eburnea MCA 4105]
MSDGFFKAPRPFTKRKREDGPNRRGGDRPAGAGGRGRGRGGSRGGGSSTRGASRGGGRGGSSSRGGKRDSKGKGREAEQQQEDSDEDLDEPDGGLGFDSDDEEIESDAGGASNGSSDEEDEDETPAQKRLRLSQMYLKSLEKETMDEGDFDAADLDRDLIAERLQQDVLEHTGKLHLNIADSLILPVLPSQIHQTPSKSHRGPITSAVVSSTGSHLYTSSKDGSIIKWSLPTFPIPSTSTTTSTITPSRITQLHYLSKAPSQSQKRKFAQKRGTESLSKAERELEREANEEILGKKRDPGGHTDQVLCLALSADGKCLASGGKDKVLGVWDVEGEKAAWRRGLGGHKDQVASVAFRLGTHQLYSSSFDRTVKSFDLSTLSYIETLFGHQDSISQISSLRSETAVTAGGRDKTVRYWKVAEESQLVFRGGGASRMRNVLDGAMEEEGVEEEVEIDGRKRKRGRKGDVKFVEGSVDCVAMVDDTTFLSGGDSGSICLWSTTKKKPIHTHQLAHGVESVPSETEGDIQQARWITSLACLPYGDTFASGSWDGQINLWKIDASLRSFSHLTSIPVPGFINSLQLVSPRPNANEKRTKTHEETGKSLVVVAAASKEPRLGRWKRIKEAREGAVVVVVPVA